MTQHQNFYWKFVEDITSSRLLRNPYKHSGKKDSSFEMSRNSQLYGLLVIPVHSDTVTNLYSAFFRIWIDSSTTLYLATTCEKTPPDLPKKDVRSGSCPNETMLSGGSSAMFWNRCKITSAVAPVQSCELFLNKFRAVGHAPLLRSVRKEMRLADVSVKGRAI